MKVAIEVEADDAAVLINALAISQRRHEQLIMSITHQTNSQLAFMKAGLPSKDGNTTQPNQGESNG